jgi:hypothetical protein
MGLEKIDIEISDQLLYRPRFLHNISIILDWLPDPVCPSSLEEYL